MRDDPTAVGPLPEALILDTSFLRTLGPPARDRYQAFTTHVRATDLTLYMTEGVVDEVIEQAGYIGGDWLGLADSTDWVEQLGPIQPGVRVHDGPRAGEVIDWAHERLASLEQEHPDELRPTDAALAGAAVMILGSKPHDTVGIVLDDRNAEDALETALHNTYYDDRVRILDIWSVVEYTEAVDANSLDDSDGDS
jgi:hypothetical protein